MSALNKKSFLTYLKEGGIYVVLLVLLAIIIFQDPTFLSLLNLSNILTQSSVRIIIALGVAGLIVTQGTDLSAGRQVGLAAVVAATLLQSMDNANKVFPEMATMPIALVILIVCAIGAVIGLINGLIIAYLNVTPFIALVILIVCAIGAVIGLINGLIIAYLNVTPFITTLGTMIIVYGINSLYYDFVGASPISGFDSGFSTFAQGFVALGSFRLSYITFYALIAVAFVWVLWNKTRFGKNIFAIGGNPEAAKVSGVNVGLNLLMIYALSGVFYAFGGMLEAGRIGSATNNLGFMYELDAIAACVVGGVSFSGGVGTVIGVVTGVIIFTVINYGLTYIGVNPYWQYIIKGAIIIFAVALDSLKYARKK
ncbi:galactose/methyl galactoside ABC transporter permease MglC [Escherichia coli]